MAANSESYLVAYPVAVYDPAAKDGADSVNLGTLLNTRNAIDGETTAYVRAILSVGAATVTIVVVLYDQDDALIGLASPGVQTATASAYTNAAAAKDYHAPILSWDCAGAASYEVRSGDPSSGTRALTTWAV